MKIGIALMVALLGMAWGQVQVGNWTFLSEPDPVTSRPRTLIFTPANEKTNAALALGCTPQGQELVVYLLTGRYIGSAPSVRVLWRFDVDPSPSEAQVQPSKSGTALYFFDYETEFVNKLKSSTTLATRVYSSLGDSHTYTFNVRGFADALRLLPCDEL